MIDKQVKLPARVALAVVLQGIRIRFGRSLVTIGGVGLGVAFLMSSLTGQLIKQAVKHEDEKRAEIRRMASFLAAEMGPPHERVIGVIQNGPLNEAEMGLLVNLIAGGLRKLQWYSQDASAAPDFGDGLEASPLDSVARGASCLIVMGTGELTAPLAHLFGDSAERIVAVTRGDQRVDATPEMRVVSLAREMSEEELAQAAKASAAARIRSMWILIISVVVTVAGISNAMLMSVTERFREIGTMKCLGALSSFIRWMFLMESGLVGAAGGIMGALLGAAFSIVAYSFSYGAGAVLSSMDVAHLALYLLAAITAGIALSMLAAIYPAGVAASMVPANALTTNV